VWLTTYLSHFVVVAKAFAPVFLVQFHGQHVESNLKVDGVKTITLKQQEFKKKYHLL
jgi:hypothetical protein